MAWGIMCTKTQIFLIMVMLVRAQFKAGMTIAIEPMATLGQHHIKMDDDGWTIRTADKTISAHFEHTVLITPDGYEILTAMEIFVARIFA